MRAQLRSLARVTNSLSTLTLILLVLSASLNVALAKRVSTLRLTIDALKSEGNLKPGAQLPSLQGLFPDGTPAQVHLQNQPRPTLLYIFTPTCSWCSRNLDNIRAIAQMASNRFNIVGVSLTHQGLEAYVKDSALSFPILSVNREVQAQLKLGGTPQTLLVSGEGKLLKNWRGAYQGAIKTEIEKELRISLPGLKALAQNPRSSQP